MPAPPVWPPELGSASAPALPELGFEGSDPEFRAEAPSGALLVFALAPPEPAQGLSLSLSLSLSLAGAVPGAGRARRGSGGAGAAGAPAGAQGAPSLPPSAPSLLWRSTNPCWMLGGSSPGWDGGVGSTGKPQRVLGWLCRAGDAPSTAGGSLGGEEGNFLPKSCIPTLAIPSCPGVCGAGTAPRGSSVPLAVTLSWIVLGAWTSTCPPGIGNAPASPCSGFPSVPAAPSCGFPSVPALVFPPWAVPAERVASRANPWKEESTFIASSSELCSRL